MAENLPSRFTSASDASAQQALATPVDPPGLSDFRKRRAEALDAQERDASLSGTSTPDRSHTGTPDNAGNSDTGHAAAGGPPLKKKLKKKAAGKKLLSFGDDDEDAESTSTDQVDRKGTEATKEEHKSEKKAKFQPNAAVGIVPKAMTKAALRKEAQEREALRQEFLSLQEAVKATEVAIPFVFYDGASTPGGTVRVKKGDYTWLFLDKSRRVGAELGTGDKSAARKAWARVGVDDLMLVRGTVIVPHHYDFLYFIMNKSVGPGGQRIFDYSAEKPPESDTPVREPGTTVTASSMTKNLPDISTLEGAKDDPNLTKVVDRRWYEKNKHIYPSSVWQEFDPDKDYTSEVRRDMGGNTFFFSK